MSMAFSFFMMLLLTTPSAVVLSVQIVWKVEDVPRILRCGKQELLPNS